MLSYFQELQSMVAEIWSDTPAAQRPKIIGPDNDFDPGTRTIFPRFIPFSPVFYQVRTTISTRGIRM